MCFSVSFFPSGLLSVGKDGKVWAGFWAFSGASLLSLIAAALFIGSIEHAPATSSIP